MSFESQHATSY